MSYNFMSNIVNFSDVSRGIDAFQEVTINQEINFYDKQQIKHEASFLMIRASDEEDLLIELSPSGYCVYIPSGELWSVDSIGEIDKFIIRKFFNSDTKQEKLNGNGKIQWMIGYK